MYRDCGISWYGPNKRYQVEIGKDVHNLFDETNRDIEIEIDGKTFYSHLPDSFFSKCKHLRTAYDNKNVKGTNYLHEWIDENNIKRAKLVVIEEPIKYKLTKIQ
ncbi:hypothetical protein V7O61_06495 [Methanolobus sp. WCC1]|uniref:hypothetical protein n=1 Tax=unclassified Methanolobus TaxID=2629569 RepID=UPI0032453581